MTQPARVVVGTAGHIDHGKSALVRALTGTDPDRLPEEKERGITIDLGFAHAPWDGVTFSFVDVPGHERFVRTMVAGASGIDIALVVVASDDSVMPQTREHVAILKVLGVPQGVIARTKSDVVDAETGALVEEEIRELVRGSFLEAAPIVAVSSVTGEGLEALKKALRKAASRVDPEARGGRVPRLPVDRAFTMKGFGPVVTGTLSGGGLAAGESLFVHPEGLDVKIRRIEVHGEERERAEPGDRTSLNVTGAERSALGRGQTLFPKGALTPSPILTVELLPLPGARLESGMRVRLHHGTADLFAKLTLLDPPFAQLFAEESVAALRGDRFVLRRPSPVETLGGGRVLDTARARIKPKDASRRDLEVLRSGSDEDVASLLLRDLGARGLDAPWLAHRLGIAAPRAAALLAALAARGETLRVGPAHVAPGAAKAMTGRATELLAERRDQPNPSWAKGAFLERLGGDLPASMAEAWLSLLVATKTVGVESDEVRAPGAARVTDDASSFAARIAEAYRTAAFEAPKSFDLARALSTKPAVVDGLVSHLLKTNVLVRLSPDLVVHSSTVEEAAKRLDPLKGRTLSVADFRDLLGLTRKNLIPLLEHLDRLKRTRRAGDARIVL